MKNKMKHFALLAAAVLGLIGCSKPASDITVADNHAQPVADTATADVNLPAPELIKVGATMPDLTLKTSAGKTITLRGMLKGHKALLLNFWFYT